MFIIFIRPHFIKTPVHTMNTSIRQNKTKMDGMWDGGSPDNKRITNCLVSLYGKTKPSIASYSPPLRVGLHLANRYGNTSEKNPELSFHEFPSNKTLKKSWEDRIRREEFGPSSYSHVCSKHFLESDYAKPNLDTPVDFRKKRLKRGTIPSVNLRGSGVSMKNSLREIA